ncbi:MAG TPA: hypothetical protein VF220_05900, partial [Nitrososphaeraceae archaeon]
NKLIMNNSDNVNSILEIPPRSINKLKTAKYSTNIDSKLQKCLIESFVSAFHSYVDWVKSGSSDE